MARRDIPTQEDGSDTSPPAPITTRNVLLKVVESVVPWIMRRLFWRKS